MKIRLPASNFLVCAFVLTLLALIPSGHGETHPPPNAREHWAFQPLQPVAVPAVRNERWAKTEIDRFILARLESARSAPALAADPRTLLRRMSFDLLGLPPTAADVDAFSRAVSRHRDQAIAEWTERLLANPHYGERWGRYWLDIARYSDTKGYVYAREESRFVHAPTYRDWVIQSFNHDRPFDQFLLFQIAADQLVATNSPDLAAMGFLTGGRRFLGVTHDIIDDRIDVVTRGTMALTVQCARCHDHKYDPIPTADYYSLYGVFHGCDDRLVPLDHPRDAELNKRRATLANLMAKRRGEAGARLRARVGDYLVAQLELEKYPEEGFDQYLNTEDIIPASVRRWRDYLNTSRSLTHPIFGPWFALTSLSVSNFAAEAPAVLARARAEPALNPIISAALTNLPTSARNVAIRYGEAFARAQRETNAPGATELLKFLEDPHSPTVVPDTAIINNEQFFPTTQTEELWKTQGNVDRRLNELGVAAALTLSDRDPEPNPHVFKRGSAARLGEEVPRQFLSVLSRGTRQPFSHGSGRLDLARAIASADNPLTARVMVNRIWQHHFGTGLVKTPSDLGLRAERPSHPELLDWLANRFIAEGWSVKAIHRLILASAVYQQSGSPSQNPGAGDKANDPDPENRLLSHFPAHRLEFEALRDAMLTASGEIDLSLGGKPNGLMEPTNRRRTIYTFIDRQFLPGTLRTFDFANPDIHVSVRHETTVPQQALFFLNGTFAADRARALARTLPDRPSGRGLVATRVNQLHRQLYQREATAAEIDAAREFVAMAEREAAPPAPVVDPAWTYGTGEYDEPNHRLKSFAGLPHFTGVAWQGAATLPGGATGWAQLTADGGHPGNTRAQACVRRWTAPQDMTIRIAGLLKHEPDEGNGVRGFIVASRHGELKSALVHHGASDMSVPSLEVKAGETIDFVVQIAETLSYNQFLWAPTISAADRSWDARAGFGGPRTAPVWLSPWEQYAQVLLLANEFAFVD